MTDVIVKLPLIVSTSHYQPNVTWSNSSIPIAAILCEASKGTPYWYGGDNGQIQRESHICDSTYGFSDLIYVQINKGRNTVVLLPLKHSIAAIMLHGSLIIQRSTLLATHRNKRLRTATLHRMNHHELFYCKYCN